MNEDSAKIAVLRSLQAQFATLAEHTSELVGDLKSESESYYTRKVTLINNLIRSYNHAKSELSVLGYHELYRSLPDAPEIGHRVYSVRIDDAISILTTLLTGCYGAYEGIEALLTQTKIPQELVNQLEGWKGEVMSIESLDYDVYKNLSEAIKEMEHGHYIASGLISARVVAWILQQIPPEGKDIENKDRKKVETLIEAGIIGKDDRDLHAIILRAARLARNFVSHRIDRYPAPEDASSLLGDAIRLAKIYVEFLKTREGSNFG
ncbi:MULTISPECIES: hypothetical protein [unclassified Archaeoglobus]|jgi:hypothetical protein|uniref:hypothetical protein n=1 Tax=unclassified Archaeoglobus TaxID=2643606 RepID=UPI0025C13539|nr:MULTISPECIES: hypothetical protein [unclassified Archaeoglobus]